MACLDENFGGSFPSSNIPVSSMLLHGRNQVPDNCPTHMTVYAACLTKAVEAIKRKNMMINLPG